MSEAPKVTVFQIAEIEEFLAFCSAITSSKRQYVFRGMEQPDHKLRSSIERRTPEEDIRNDGYAIWERYILRTFFSLHHLHEQSIAFDRNNLVEVWSLIQHYGGSTRLLDFSFSPAVALHFAIKNIHTIPKPVVWAVPLEMINRRLEVIFDLNEDPNKLKAKGFVNIPDGSNDWSLINFVTGKDILNKFINYHLRISLNTLGCSESQKDCVVPVRPPRPNQRLLMQNGIFLMPLNSFNTFQGNLEGMLQITVDQGRISREGIEKATGARFQKAIAAEEIIILKLEKCSIRKLADMLQTFNVREESLFPDFQGLMARIGNIGPLPAELRRPE